MDQEHSRCFIRAHGHGRGGQAAGYCNSSSRMADRKLDDDRYGDLDGDACFAARLRRSRTVTTLRSPVMEGSYFLIWLERPQPRPVERAD